jgi:hypothetical protein
MEKNRKFIGPALLGVAAIVIGVGFFIILPAAGNYLKG